MMRSRSPLSRRLGMVPAVLALVLTVLFVLACDALLRRHHVRAAGELTQTLAARMARDLSLDLNHSLADLQLFARRRALLPPFDAARLRAEFDTLRVLRPDIAWVGVLDADGRVKVASGEVGEVEDGSAILERGHGGPWAAELPQDGWVAARPGQGLVDLALPLRADDLSAGVLVARLSPRWVVEVRDRALQGHADAELLLFADDGRWLIGPRAGVHLPAPEALRAVGNAWRRQGAGLNEWLVASTAVPGRPGQDLGWQVVALTPMGTALAPLREVEAGLAVSGLLVALLLGAAGMHWTRRLTGPYEGLLVALAERHRQQTQGHSRPSGLTHYIDEVTRQLDELQPETPTEGEAAGGSGRMLSADAAIALLARDAVRVRQLLEQMPLGVALADARSELIYWNAGCERIFGWSADEVLGRSPHGLVLPDGVPGAAALQELLRPAGERSTQRVERPRKGGGSVWCEVQSVAVNDGSSGFRGLLLLVRDLSEERRAIAQAHEVEQQRAAMAEAAVDLVFARLDRQGRLGQWTPAVQAVFGLTEAQWQGRSVEVLFPFDDVERGLPRALVARAEAEARVEHEGWLHRQGGTRFWGNLLLYRLGQADGATTGYTLVARDLSERRATEERLRESEATLAAIIDTASDAVISTDPLGNVLLFNPAAEHIFGLRAAQTIGQPIERLVPERYRAAVRTGLAEFANSRSAQRPVGDSGKVTGLRSDGSEVRLEGSISQTTVKSTKVLTAILRDVTERMRSERALMEYQFQLSALAQRLMASEQDTNRRVAQALHDQLGQTLTALRLVFDALQAALPEAAQQSSERVRGRLGELIDRSIGEVRRVLVELRPALLQEMGLAAAIDNEVRNLAREAGPVALVFEPESSCVGHRWPAEVEYAAFMVVREALGNAIRHSGAAVVHVSLRHGTPDLQLTVHDDGSGLGDEQHRIKPGHLGLVGMRERAIAIGASLRVQSAPGEGTTITLDWSPPT